ncbi:MAG: 50S ribosomal protein L22 [Lentisphaerae bacterium]|nr:50S ribosomal protein L22 [Lentisphaerota bacterium]
MEVVSTSKYVRLAADKARDIARKMRGLPVSEALKVTDFSERKAAFYIGKTLKSAIANAENNAKLAVDELRVKEVLVDEAARVKRYWARSRGSASPIQKRTCHIKIVVTDGKDSDK